MIEPIYPYFKVKRPAPPTSAIYSGIQPKSYDCVVVAAPEETLPIGQQVVVPARALKFVPNEPDHFMVDFEIDMFLPLKPAE